MHGGFFHWTNCLTYEPQAKQPSGSSKLQVMASWAEYSVTVLATGVNSMVGNSVCTATGAAAAGAAAA